MMDNCVYTTKKLFDLLKIKFTSKYLKDNILSHPDHPSLLSISDTLEKYNIETMAVKIEVDKLKELPLPCIVQVKEYGRPLFFVLDTISDHNVSYYDDKNALVTATKDNFLKIWTGVCLAVETSADTKEPNIEKVLATKRIRNTLIGSITVLMLSWMVISFINLQAVVNTPSIIYTITYTILKLVGLTVGIMLLWYEVDEYNPTLQSFCSGGGGKVNCNAVLSSKYSKLFKGTLSLSLLGFSYFFGTFTYLLIKGFSLDFTTVLGVFSFMTLPAIVVSAYYQAFIIKQWCKFCIIIQAVLIVEVAVTYFSGFNIMAIVPENIFLLVALFLIPILSWKLLKPLLVQVKETNVHKRALRKIKHNPNVLEGLLTKSKKIETSTNGLGITINSENAKYNVIKVCNPYCGPCAKAHPVSENLVNAGKINLQVLFTARADGKDAKAKPVSHFLAIDEQGDKKKTQQALEDWYHADKKDYEIFANKYPMNGELEEQNNKIEAMRKWCNAENITHTPTIFINGYELPKEYSIEDLKEVLL